MATTAAVTMGTLVQTVIWILMTVPMADVRMVGHASTLLATSPVSAQMIMR